MKIYFFVCGRNIARNICKYCFFDHILKMSFSVSYVLGFKKENKRLNIGDLCDYLI